MAQHYDHMCGKLHSIALICKPSSQLHSEHYYTSESMHVPVDNTYTGGSMSSQNPHHVDLSLAKLLPSLPWSTDVVVKKSELLLSEKLLHDYSVSVIATPYKKYEISADKTQDFVKQLYAQERTLLSDPSRTKERSLRSYFQSFLGYNKPMISYQKDHHIQFFPICADIIMQYRLCDVLNWVYCPGISGPVPIHARRSYKSPDKSVSKSSHK